MNLNFVSCIESERCSFGLYNNCGFSLNSLNFKVFQLIIHTLAPIIHLYKLYN
jgi:hypothetical protein